MATSINRFEFLDRCIHAAVAFSVNKTQPTILLELLL